MSVQAATPAQTYTVRIGALILVTVAVAVFAFGDALLELVKRWNAEEEYSHGFLIPVVSAGLLWMRRDALRASMGRPSWAGPVVILAAIAMQIIGEYTTIYILSQFAFILVLFGVALAAGGYSLLRTASVPIAFLIFAIPVPYFIESNLTLQLQLISSRLGVEVIQLFRIPVYLEGNIIDLGNYKLAVVEACSGLRYLYPLLSLSFLAAYLFQAPIWQRALVFLSGIPITIGMNGLRIGLVGVSVGLWGPQMAEEVLHSFEGWIIFIACAGILIAEIFLLARFSGKSFYQSFNLPALAGKSPNDKSSEYASQWALVTSLVLVCAAGVISHSISQRPEFAPNRVRFVEFPSTFGEWKGRSSLLDQDVEQALRLDDYLLADYHAADGKPVNLYVAYYNSQRNGYSPHSPVVCLPGGGWLITQFDRTSYNLGGAELPFNRVIMEQGKDRQLVYYWFDERGRQVANEYTAKWYLLVDAIFKNRTDGALIRLITDIRPTETEHDADERLQTFMRDVVPNLRAYLPSEPTSRATSDLSHRNNFHG
jgi:exosortase D (VPLPA-CTERM-specific)